jgi:glycerol-3-phosphate dehydrogenase (NAD(P)+)
VLAIACGVVDGLGLGQNARAALIARGYAEMLRFGLARGRAGETLGGAVRTGRSGADLFVHREPQLSRWARRWARGLSAAEALAGKNSVAEGAHTAPVLHALAHSQGIAMPIVEAVCRLLNGEAPAKLVVAELLARPLTTEGARL